MTIPPSVREAMGEDRCFLIGYRGSVAHGTYQPNEDPLSVDDKDLMAFIVPPADHYHGLREYGSRGTREIVEGEWDVVVYEARKAIRLLAQGNPNVLSMLWLPENLYVRRTDAGRLLIERRGLFVGRHVYQAFVGYAKAQFVKMERGVYKGYMGARRKALVDRFGYDPKSASHLIRLLRQGAEFLRDGELLVQRPDAAELLAIKRGEWPLERVKAEATRLFERAEAAYDRSSLPPRPNADYVNELCCEVVEMGLRLNA